MEQRLIKLERDMDRVWHKLEVFHLRQTSLESIVGDISSTLKEINGSEIKKAVERQQMLNTLQLVLDSQMENREDFVSHIKDEMLEQKKIKKWLLTTSGLIIAIVVDSQAHTNIVGGVWSYAVKNIVGV